MPRSGPLPHASGARNLLTKNMKKCCLVTTEKPSWLLPWPSTTVTSLQAQSQKAHFWAWLRKEKSLNTKLWTCFRKFSEAALILRASWQILLSKFTSGWSWQGAWEMRRMKWFWLVSDCSHQQQSHLFFHPHANGGGPPEPLDNHICRDISPTPTTSSYCGAQIQVGRAVLVLPLGHKRKCSVLI